LKSKLDENKAKIFSNGLKNDQRMSAIRWSFFNPLDFWGLVPIRPVRES